MKELTAREEILENIRICKGLMSRARADANADDVAHRIERRRRGIVQLEQEIREITASHASAKDRLSRLREAQSRLLAQLAAHDNRYAVERFVRLAKQLMEEERR